MIYTCSQKSIYHVLWVLTVKITHREQEMDPCSETSQNRQMGYSAPHHNSNSLDTGQVWVKHNSDSVFYACRVCATCAPLTSIAVERKTSCKHTYSSKSDPKRALSFSFSFRENSLGDRRYLYKPFGVLRKELSVLLWEDVHCKLVNARKNKKIG